MKIPNQSQKKESQMMGLHPGAHHRPLIPRKICVHQGARRRLIATSISIFVVGTLQTRLDRGANQNRRDTCPSVWHKTASRAWRTQRMTVMMAVGTWTKMASATQRKTRKSGARRIPPASTASMTAGKTGPLDHLDRPLAHPPHGNQGASRDRGTTGGAKKEACHALV